MWGQSKWGKGCQTLTIPSTTLRQSQHSRSESRRHRCGAIIRAIFTMMLGVTIEKKKKKRIYQLEKLRMTNSPGFPKFEGPLQTQEFQF